MAKEEISKEEKPKKKISFWLGCGGVLLFFFIIGIIAMSCASLSTKNNPTSKPSETAKQEETKATPTTEAPKPKQWVTVLELSGTTDKKSDIFELTGGKTKMTYNFNGNDYIAGSIYLVNEGKDLTKNGGFPEVSISKSGEDSTFITRGAGKYYLDVKAVNTNGWTIKIEEEK